MVRNIPVIVNNNIFIKVKIKIRQEILFKKVISIHRLFKCSNIE